MLVMEHMPLSWTEENKQRTYDEYLRKYKLAQEKCKKVLGMTALYTVITLDELEKGYPLKPTTSHTLAIGDLVLMTHIIGANTLPNGYLDFIYSLEASFIAMDIYYKRK